MNLGHYMTVSHLTWPINYMMECFLSRNILQKCFADSFRISPFSAVQNFLPEVDIHFTVPHIFQPGEPSYIRKVCFFLFPPRFFSGFFEQGVCFILHTCCPLKPLRHFPLHPSPARQYDIIFNYLYLLCPPMSPIKCRWYAYCSVFIANGAFRFFSRPALKT